MADHPDNFPLPHGISEDDVIDLVEGEPLSRERHASLADMLNEHPALARRVEAMRRDRAALRSLGNAAAPAELVAAVEAALQPILERQMLLGLQEGAPISDRLPVSIVVPARRRLRPLAVAAGFLLMVGGGAFIAFTMMRSPTIVPERTIVLKPAEPEPVTIATGPAPAEAAPARTAGEPLPTLGGEPEPITLAVAPESGPLEPLEPLESPAPEMWPLPPGPMEAGEALALASRGRLVVRVVALDSRMDRVLEQLRRARSGGWQFAGEAPPAIAALLEPYGPEELAAPRRMERPIIASYNDPGLQAIDMGPPPPPFEARRTPRVYVVSARLDEGSLSTLRRTLREAGAMDVRFEESEPLPIEADPLANPGAVLWWGQGPSAWGGWSAVPVIIQR